MRKIVELMKNRKMHYAMLFIIGLVICIPFFWLQLRDSDDGFIHLLRLISLQNAFSDGGFPFLLTPFFCRNFGYSMTVFYPPLVTFIPYIISKMLGSYASGLKVFSALTVSISGIFMYNFVNEVTKNKKISFLSAIIYMVFPYRLEDMFNRFAIGEFTAFVFMPIVFQGLYNLLNGDGKKHFYIAIGAIGLMLSHTISTIYIALFCVIYILFNIKKFLKKEVIKKCIFNVIVILLISAFFIIPMLEFNSKADYAIFKSNLMKTDGNYTQSVAIEPWQFIKDKVAENPVSFVIGIPTLVMLCITILAFQHVNEKNKDFYLTYLIMGIVCMFMCTKYFPWLYMPQLLNNIQFPWRLVGFAMFFLSPVLAMNVCCLVEKIKKENIKYIIYGLIIVFIGIFTVFELRAYQVVNPGADKVYEKERIENPIISHMGVNREYLPVNAINKQSTYMKTREDRVYILQGSADVYNENKYALDLSFELKNGKKDTMLELPYLFYPGYVVTLDANSNTKNLEITESENGFVSVTLPEDVESGKITLEYKGTTIETVSYIISLIAFIAFIAYIIYFKIKKVGEKNEGEN